MIQKFTLECPACNDEMDIEAEVQELIDDKGALIECPECGADVEFDYTKEAGLTVTAGQEFEDIEEQDPDDADADDFEDGPLPESADEDDDED